VNTTDQAEILSRHKLINEWGVPIFPLNTDGIDPSGKNILIQNVRIENFDDAVAVKPQNKKSFYSSCRYA
jgi:polygalacturonase